MPTPTKRRMPSWYAERNPASTRVLDHCLASKPAAASGSTQLLAAAQYGRSEDVRALLDAGARARGLAGGALGSLGAARDTALHVACFSGHIDVVRVLLGRPAGQRSGLEPDLQGFTPLHYAAKLGHTDIVELLLVCARPLPSDLWCALPRPRQLSWVSRGCFRRAIQAHSW